MTDTTEKELPCRGELTVVSIDKNGNVLHEYETPNTIVFDARDIMAQLLVGDSVSTVKIGKIGVGVGSVAPARADTSLVNEILKVDITGYDFPVGNPGHIEITALLDYTSGANGQDLTEAGLFTTDGTKMFARQIFGSITKTSSLQLQFIWRIIFT